MIPKSCQSLSPSTSCPSIVSLEVLSKSCVCWSPVCSHHQSVVKVCVYPSFVEVLYISKSYESPESIEVLSVPFIKVLSKSCVCWSLSLSKSWQSLCSSKSCQSLFPCTVCDENGQQSFTSSDSNVALFTDSIVIISGLAWRVVHAFTSTNHAVRLSQSAYMLDYSQSCGGIFVKFVKGQGLEQGKFWGLSVTHYEGKY